MLGLNELPFDITGYKEDIIEILKANVNTLRYLSLSRNALTTSFMIELCASICQESQLEKIEIRYVTDIYEADTLIFDYLEVFKAIAAMS